MKPRIYSIRLRAVDNRNEPCYFCGKHVSVKYDAEFTEDGVNKIVPCCTICALFGYALNNADRNEAEMNCTQPR